MFNVKLPDGQLIEFEGDAYEIDAATVKQVLARQYPVLNTISGDGEWDDDTLVFSRPQGGTKA